MAAWVLEEEGLQCLEGWFVTLGNVLLTTDLLIFPTQGHIPVSPPHTSSYSNHSWSLICVPETLLTFAKELGEEGGKNKKDIHQSLSSSQDRSLELQASFMRTPIVH